MSENDYKAEIDYWKFLAEEAWKMGFKRIARDNYAIVQELESALKWEREMA